MWETRRLWGLHQLQKSLTNNLAATYVELKEISTLIPDLSEQFTKAHRREINYMQLRILVTKTRPKILERFSRALFYSLNCLRVSLEALGSTVWEHICCAE